MIDKLEVELVDHSPGAPFTGIGRYTREMYNHLSPRLPVRLTTHLDPPLTHRLAFLHHFPIGVTEHRAGSIVHFMEDMGCSQMLWRPVHPAVATSHDLGMLVWSPEARMHRAFDRLILGLSYLGLKRMDAVITVSEYSRRTVIQRLRIPPKRVFTVHSGNDHNLFRPVADARAKLEERYGLPHKRDTKNLLYVGAEFPRKNLATVLATLTQLPPNVRLLKVGVAGGEKFRISTKKTIAELDLDHRVFFLGKVPEEDLPLLYSAADAYVCASFLEGFGHPVVEAMACGTPVVCSNTSSLPEIAGDAAILVPPENSRAFAEAIHTVLYDETLRERVATRGLHQAAKFSWERTADAVMAVYARLASGAKQLNTCPAPV
jgi:alpha-1,3-rhamnosyl/mannosyltransferase